MADRPKMMIFRYFLKILILIDKQSQWSPDMKKYLFSVQILFFEIVFEIATQVNHDVLHRLLWNTSASFGRGDQVDGLPRPYKSRGEESEKQGRATKSKFRVVFQINLNF